MRALLTIEKMTVVEILFSFCIRQIYSSSKMKRMPGLFWSLLREDLDYFIDTSSIEYKKKKNNEVRKEIISWAKGRSFTERVSHDVSRRAGIIL
jgi:hypothetical protein